MSASAPPKLARPSESGKLKPQSASDDLVEARIDEACRSLWWAELVRRSLRLVMGILAAVIAWIVVDHWIYAASPIVRMLALGSGIIAVMAYVYLQIWPLVGTSVQPEYAARSLEKTNPELRHSLTSYVTLRRHRQDGGLSGRVVRSLGSSTANYLKTHDELPLEATGTMRWWVATAVMLAGLLAYAALSPKNSLQSVSRLLAPMAELQPSTRVQITDVSPGDAEAIAGRSVNVTAQIRGIVSSDEKGCRLELTSGERFFPLVASKNEGEFAFECVIDVPSSASGTIPYTLVAGDAVAGPYQLHVEDVPVIALETIHYQPPAYTGREPYSRTTGAISAIDGTEITLTARCNRPVARGTIEFNPKSVGDRIQATDGAIELQVSDNGKRISATFPLRIAAGRSREVRRDSYRVRVWDAAGSGNPDPIIYPIDIIADLPPEIAIMLPTRSPQDVPLTAQQMIEVHASDADFGLTEMKLEIKSGIQTLGEPVLWSHDTGKVGNQVAEYRLRPAEMGLEVGNVVRVTAFAKDNRQLANAQVASSSKTTANITVTDTIEIRIVADSAVPPAGQADENGISEPDDQPAADPSSEDDSSSDQSGDGQPQSGGEQGSQGQSGGSGESADQQQTGGSGGDGSTENQGEGEGEGGGESGDAGESEGQNKGDQSGDMSDGQESSEQESSEQESAKQGAGGQESGEGMQENASPPNGDPSPGEQATREQTTGERDAGDQDAGDQDPADQTAGEPSGGEAMSAGGDSSDDQGSKAGDSSSEASPDGADQGKQGDAQGGEPENGEVPPEGKPQHDGEAFERIRDYLEKQKQEQPKESGKEGKNGQEDQQGGQDAPSSDASDSASQSSGDQEQGQNGEAKSDPANQDDSGQDGSGQNGKPGQEPQQGEKPSEGEAASNNSTGENPDQNGSMNSDSESQDGQPSDADSSETPDGKPGENGSSENQSSEKQPSSESAAGDPEQTESEPGSEPSSETSQGNQKSDGSPPPMQGNPGSTDGSEGNTEGGEQIQDPVDEINQDYAKEATDMVLDYLDQTRDQPDQDLLEQLDWSEADLQRFRDRWQKVRELEKAPATDPQAKRKLEDAMRSLGLKPPSNTSNTQTRDAADSLRGIRDSGNRRPPPAEYRDAFDAFRRSLSK